MSKTKNTNKETEMEISVNGETPIKTTLEEFSELAKKVSRKKTKGQVSAGSERITIKHEFTKAELETKGGELAQACAKREQFEDQKKQVNSEFKYKLDSVNAEINLLSSHISQKFEMQNVEAELILDFDSKKRIFTHEGIIVHKEPLREEDLQLKAAI